jgi:hypothetical protein
MSSLASNAPGLEFRPWSPIKSSLSVTSNGLNVARPDVIVKEDYCLEGIKKHFNAATKCPKSVPSPGWINIRRKMLGVNSKRAETARRMSSIRGPFPPSPSSYPYKSMARELIELGKMYTDGLLTKDEFMKAKADLVN